MIVEKIHKIKKKFQIDNSDLLAYFFISAFVIFFALLSIGRHDALKSYLNDLGTYDQIIWNSIHGDFLKTSVSMLNEENLLAGHFSPILILFIPFYLIKATPYWFLLFQALAVGMSAWPIFLFARERLKCGWLPLVFLGSYLLYAPLHNGLLYDFHEIVLATGFASWAFYFLHKENYRMFIVMSLLLSFCQEFMPLFVLMMGIYLILIRRRKWKLGLAVSLIALAYFLLVITVLMPAFSTSGNAATLDNSSQYGSRYVWLGTSVTEILGNLLTHPVQIIQILLSYERLRYIFILAAPVFSLAFYSLPIIIILPVLGLYLLSINPMMYSVSFYHASIFAPFIYFSAILAYERWFLINQNLKRLFAGLILISSVVTCILFGLSPASFNYKFSDYWPTDHSRMIEAVKNVVPRESTASVQHNLGPHFSHRSRLYRFPLGKSEAEYIVLDQIDPYAGNPKQIFQFPYALQMDYLEWQNEINIFLGSPDHDLIFNQDGYLVFKKK